LLEKAYAKFYGSYDFIKRGFSSEAMVDFTGGIIERIELKYAEIDLFITIQKSLENGSLVAAAIIKPELLSRHIKNKGLLNLHEFTISKAENIMSCDNKPRQLLRIRNPHGSRLEWKGKFSDKSKEWNKLPAKNVKELREQEVNGEFFMGFNDFLDNFDIVELCHVCPKFWSPALDAPLRKKYQWNTKSLESQWNGHNSSKQFIVHLEEEDEIEECTMIVSLTQKNRRKINPPYLPIKIDVYLLTDDQFNLDFLSCEFFSKKAPVKHYDFKSHREVCHRFQLKAGYYAIVPRTMNNESEHFSLQIFSEIYHKKKEVFVRMNEERLHSKL
jgi:hypothetical protein